MFPPIVRFMRFVAFRALSLPAALLSLRLLLLLLRPARS